MQTHGIEPSRYNWGVSENEVKQIASADFPTRWGKFRIYGFRGETGSDGSRRVEEAVALVMGDVKSAPPLVRVHSQCLTGDVFHSLRCDCRQQLELSLSLITEKGAGILIYEQQEGRGIGLMAKLQAYGLQDEGLDTVEANERLGFKADHRDFTLPAEILKALGITRVRLLERSRQGRSSGTSRRQSCGARALRGHSKPPRRGVPSHQEGKIGASFYVQPMIL